MVHVVPSGTPPQHKPLLDAVLSADGIAGTGNQGTLLHHSSPSLLPPALGAGLAPGGKHSAFPKALHHTISFRQQEMRDVGPSWHMQLQTRAPERWKVVQPSHIFGLVSFHLSITNQPSVPVAKAMNLIHSPTGCSPCPAKTSLQHNSTFQDKLHLDCRDQSRLLSG